MRILARLRAHRTPLGERGIALPIALLGLVAVSLMVTTALLTSSSEVAIGTAHVDATRSLYTAEQGLNSWLTNVATNSANLTAGTATWRVPNSTDDVQLTTVRLSQVTNADQSVMRTFAITAEPMRSGSPAGRAVVAMVKQFTPGPPTVNMNITSAITLGGDLEVNGNAFTVNGRFDGCGVNGGVDAVRSAFDSQITTNNERHMDNFLGINDGGAETSGRAAIDSTGLTREQLGLDVLGGLTIDQLISALPLSKKWGPRFGRPAWDGVLDTVPTREDAAAVDANGGTVDVTGGSGMLIIVNGNVELEGNTVFDGIIIVEGNFTLSGTPSVTGSLISLASTGQNSIDQDASAISNGHITVQFDRCQIDAALQALGRASTPATPLTSTTFSWFELVR
ncbi:MAG TPA: pilus assembly PilX N-terminal domain-containing protein [Longimicrobiaceae bacterium]|nr:pilus assembly PilX N-terminal domain-containing protein [Longimicrobiaceae bacterium]